MENSIKKQLELIEKSNQWIHTSLSGNKQKETYRSMVNYRRKLNKKKFALEGNPAAAMYGESQAGKSYLVSALLSIPGETFKVYDGVGNEYDFKNQINPRGNEMESTSLVTRFSTKYKQEYEEYPIIAKMLSPTDLILILCEAYYHNLNVNKPLSFEELKEKIDEIESTYTNKTECQRFIIEDDVLDIKDYFNDNFSQLVYNNIKDAGFFEKLFSFVTKIPIDDWKAVFSLFWNFNPQLTRLFSDLIDQYKLIGFIDTVYLPIDSVLRNKGTLLDVSRLDEIYGSFRGQEIEYSPNTSLFYIDKLGKEHLISFSKPYLCALISELIFVLPEDIKKEKSFLDQTDLLDFPGTRRYENTSENNISDDSLTVLLRRGKVDYLFNKYSNNERINTLLFCQNHKQSNQSVMPEKLNRWIGSMIGENAKERENFKSPVSPLFVISTWFNKDLEFDFSNDKAGNVQTLNERWSQRFEKTLQKEIFKTDTFPWLIDWTTSQRNFRNIFLLRDFDKSSETNSQIYKGFNTDNKEVEEIFPDSYPNFRKDLRKSFLNYDFVQRHFEDPVESWDEAASINKDGTNLIIKKLTIAAEHINSARRDKTILELNNISESIISELQKHFHSTDKDEKLQKAISTAGSLQFRFDTAFIADGIKKYGQFMKELMLDEASVLELFRKTIDDLEHRDIVNLDIYSNYIRRVPILPEDTADTYFERLCVAYEKRTDEDKKAFNKELEELKIDLNELISHNAGLIKNNAQQLAETLIDYWLSHITLNDKQVIQSILANNGNSYLDDFADMYKKLFEKLEISDLIARKIRRYIDKNNKTDLPYEIVADISTELLNKCINTVGFDYLDNAAVKELEEAKDKNKLNIIVNSSSQSVENSVEELFTRIDNWTDIIQTNPDELKTLPNYRNYITWCNRLKVGFVYVCDIPNYDIDANERLGSILEKTKTIKY